MACGGQNGKCCADGPVRRGASKASVWGRVRHEGVGALGCEGGGVYKGVGGGGGAHRLQRGLPLIPHPTHWEGPFLSFPPCHPLCSLHPSLPSSLHLCLCHCPSRQEPKIWTGHICIHRIQTQETSNREIPITAKFSGRNARLWLQAPMQSCPQLDPNRHHGPCTLPDHCPSIWAPRRRAFACKEAFVRCPLMDVCPFTSCVLSPFPRSDQIPLRKD